MIKKNGRYLSVDGPVDEYRELISNVFDGNVEAFVETYYNLVGEMIKNSRPTLSVILI